MTGRVELHASRPRAPSGSASSPPFAHDVVAARAQFVYVFHANQRHGAFRLARQEIKRAFDASNVAGLDVLRPRDVVFVALASPAAPFAPAASFSVALAFVATERIGGGGAAAASVLLSLILTPLTRNAPKPICAFGFAAPSAVTLRAPFEDILGTLCVSARANRAGCMRGSAVSPRPGATDDARLKYPQSKVCSDYN